jgi:hypothetical protein
MSASPDQLDVERCLEILGGWNHKEALLGAESEVEEGPLSPGQKKNRNTRKKRREKKESKKYNWIRDIPAYTAWMKRTNRQLNPNENESLRPWIAGAGSTAMAELALFITQELRRTIGQHEEHAQVLYFCANRQDETLIKSCLKLIDQVSRRTGQAMAYANSSGVWMMDW